MPYHKSLYYEHLKGDETLPLLVFCHGVSSNMSVWEPYLASFPHEKLLIDLPGYARSSRIPLDFGVQVKRVISLLRSLVSHTNGQGKRNMILIGNCYGATLFSHAALSFPNQIEKVVILNPYSPSFLRYSFMVRFNSTCSHVCKALGLLTQQHKHYHYPKLRRTPFILHFYHNLRTQGMHHWFRGAYLSGKIHLPLMKLLSYRIPLLLVSGSKDMWINHFKVQEVQHISPYATVHIIPTPHLFVVNYPHILIPILEDFILEGS